MAELTRLIERLEWADKVLNALPSDHYAQVPPGAEAAAALKAAEAEIKQLRNMERNARRTLTMERETLCKSRDRQLDVAKSQAEQAEADLAAARAEIERLREGLRPFAEEAAHWDDRPARYCLSGVDSDITVGHLRQAHDLLGKPGNG